MTSVSLDPCAAHVVSRRAVDVRPRSRRCPPAPAPVIRLAWFALAALWMIPRAGAAGPAGEWSILPGDPPAARAFHAAIYDLPGDRMVVFGGQPVCDTWSLTFTGVGPGWRHHSTLGPSPRYGHSAIYDPLRDRMIVFGGVDAVGGYALNDVWEIPLHGTETWAQLATSGTPPSGRTFHSAVYDPGRDRMIVFGGRVLSYQGGGGSSTDEVWALSLGATPTWTPLAPPGSFPLPRDRATMVYDSRRDRLLIYGGWHQFTSAYLNDTWALTLGALPEWIQIGVSGAGPGRRRDGLGVYDAASDRLVFFGGDNGSLRNDTWQLPLDAPVPTWSEIVGPTRPAPRNAASVVLDPARRRMIVFGGPAGAPLNDVWALPLDGTTGWADISPSISAPGRRDLFSGVYDGGGQRMVVFGGYNGVLSFTSVNDTWALSLGSFPAWAQIVTQGTPPSRRYGHSAIADPTRRQMVVFGGSGSPLWLNDVWILDLASAAWSRPAVGGAPPSPRYFQSAIYDGSRDRMVIFGGYQAYDPNHPENPAFVNDTYRFSLATHAWTVILNGPSTPPSGRILHSAIYDPVRDRMIVFGGIDNFGVFHNDVWALRFADPVPWQSLTPLGTPPAGRRGHFAIYDPLRDRMVVFGGEDAQRSFGDVWELSFAGVPTWTELSPGGLAPVERALGATAYDPGTDRMVVCSGSVGGILLNDTGLLAWASPTAVEVSLVSARAEGGLVVLDWYAATGAGLQATAYRRTEHSEWEALGSVSADGTGYLLYEDRAVSPGERYAYRLGYFEGGVEQFTAGTWVEVPALALALVGLRPNPAVGEPVASFTLPSGSPARLQLLDVTGRVWLAREVGNLGAGSHLVRLGGSVPAGIYWLRLTQGGRSLLARSVVVR